MYALVDGNNFYVSCERSVPTKLAWPSSDRPIEQRRMRDRTQ